MEKVKMRVPEGFQNSIVLGIVIGNEEVVEVPVYHKKDFERLGFKEVKEKKEKKEV